MPRLRPPRVPLPAADVRAIQDKDKPIDQSNSSIGTLGKEDGPEPGVTEKEDGSVSVMIADEPAALPGVPAPPVEDATSALQKQIAELKKAEQLQREQSEQRAREAAGWQRRAQEQQAQMEQLRKAQTEQEEVSIGAAIQAAKAESDKALLDYKNARDAGDTAAEAEAVDRLTDAKSRLRVLESGKQELEERKKAPVAPPQQEPAQPPRTTEELIASYPLPQDCKDWLRNHQQYLTVPRRQQELATANIWARDKGYGPGDPLYLPEIEKGLRRMNSLPKAQDQTEEEPAAETEDQNERASIVSAPVSREVPTSTGQRQSTREITLTREERDLAKTLKITEVEYAKQKRRLIEEKGGGSYGRTRYGDSDRT